KPLAAARHTLSALDIADRFAVLVGGDCTPFRKPDPRHLLACLQPLGGRPETSAMVGDSTNDEQAARSAGIAFVGVTFGYGRLSGAARVVDRFCDIPEALGL
ncbi:MAG: HAD-IA family hydrolase, partial [Alphaproteobacteria bacterium]|nr:HAD-IA family hydrolase [Alphaproteobacteria bacterium]